MPRRRHGAVVVVGRRVRVTGTVQGVGFRPFVYRGGKDVTNTRFTIGD